MKLALAVMALLGLSFCKSYALDCAMAREYAVKYTVAELAAMAASAGIVVTKEDQARYAKCFQKQKRKRKNVHAIR